MLNNNKPPRVNQANSLPEAMLNIMQHDLAELIKILVTKSLTRRGAPLDSKSAQYIYYDGFLNGMTAVAKMLQDGHLNITTLEVERK